jgi:predicted nucleotidyltransferase
MLEHQPRILPVQIRPTPQVWDNLGRRGVRTLGLATTEPKDISMASIVDAIASTLGSNAEVVAVYLYGSFVRADAGPDSDIDVLVVVEDRMPYPMSEAARCARSSEKFLNSS